MNQIDQKFLAKSRSAFTAYHLSLADLRERVMENESGTRRRDMLSALDRFSHLFGKDLADITAHPAPIRRLLQSKTASQLGLSEKRYANIRSSISAVLRKYGDQSPPLTKRITLSREWEDILACIDRKTYRFALNRIAAFGSVMGVSPAEVTGETLLGFHAALEAEEVVKSPRKILKHTIAIWNMCQRQIPGWPDIRLSSPFKEAPLSLPLSAFPQSFQDDLARYEHRLLHPDILEAEALPRPLRPTTASNHLSILRRFASVLIHGGARQPREIENLCSLFEGNNIKHGLRFLLDRLNGTPTPYLGRITSILLAVGRHYCNAPEAALLELELIGRRIRSKSGPRQLTRKNRDRLRQFDDPKNIVKLLRFPEEERCRGLQQTNPLRAAKCFERALAAALFTGCGLRIGTLRQINLQTDISWTAGKCYLSIDGSRVKNAKDLEFELADEVSSLLDEFVRDYRSRLAGADGPYLFPGKGGGPRPHSTLYHDFRDTLRKRAGLEMNPHLIRHVIAKIVVERDPGMAVAVSQHLGHMRIDMTMAHYLGTEGRASGRHINRILESAVADNAAEKGKHK